MPRVIANDDLWIRNGKLRLSRISPTPQNVSPAGSAEMAFDPVTDQAILSVNGGAWQPVLASDAAVQDVRGQGAVGDGVTDDRPALVAAIAALPAAGGVILIPADFSLFLSAGVTTGTKSVIFQGQGLSSKIIGTGFTILTLAKDKCGLRDLQITDPVGHAATIAVDINNGATGVDDWFLENVFLTGTGKLGVGLRQEFALKGHILGGEIKLFDHGVEPNTNGLFQSNANSYSGAKIRENAVGIFVGAGDIDTLFLTGCTIEGNPVGINQAAGKITAVGCHFEASGGATPTNVVVSGTANFSSFGCGFYGASALRDVIVTSGAGVHVSFGDNFANGIDHSGTGIYLVVGTANAIVTAGTGPVLQSTGQSVSGTNASSLAYAVTGWESLLSGQPLKLGTAAEGSTISAPVGGGGAWVFTPGTGSNGNINFTMGAGKLLFTDNGQLGNAGNLWKGLFTTTLEAGSGAFQIEADGDIRTSRTTAATTLGTVVAKLPIYDAAGTLIGQIPVFDTIT